MMFMHLRVGLAFARIPFKAGGGAFMRKIPSRVVTWCQVWWIFIKVKYSHNFLAGLRIFDWFVLQNVSVLWSFSKLSTKVGVFHNFEEGQIKK